MLKCKSFKEFLNDLCYVAHAIVVRGQLDQLLLYLDGAVHRES